MMRAIGTLANERLLMPLGIRVMRASSWLLTKEAEHLAASPLAHERILKLGSLLAPQEAIGVSKVRLGSQYDGGYVCLDDLHEIRGAISLGIGNNDDWDMEVAAKGITVHQFDHSIIRPPGCHKNCLFQRKKVVGRNNGSSEVVTLAELAERHGTDLHPSLILKIDIENDEWEVFAQAEVGHLRKFAQVICEFHSFSSVMDDRWYERALGVLTKLSDEFGVVHVHGNNFVRWCNLGGVLFPEFLEVTYANRGLYHFRLSSEIFPTAIDAPNDPRRPDMFLGRFVFRA